MVLGEFFWGILYPLLSDYMMDGQKVTPHIKLVRLHKCSTKSLHFGVSSLSYRGHTMTEWTQWSFIFYGIKGMFFLVFAFCN